jgi:hypothetical protein
MNWFKHQPLPLQIGLAILALLLLTVLLKGNRPSWGPM